MRVLILGGKGMLGHKLFQTMEAPFEPWATVRCEPSSLARFGFYDPARVVGGVEATDFSSIRRAFEIVRPQAAVNCVGIVKQQALAKDPEACIAINALLPHRLATLCAEFGARLVHVSTDCVFTGSRGSYTENDPTDADDLYGRTKALGETAALNAITLRTSIIGRELGAGLGVVEWFLRECGFAKRACAQAKGGPAVLERVRILGYTRALFSGFTTHELSRVIQRVLLRHPDLSGLYQVSSEPIDKASLLTLVRDAYEIPADIVPHDDVRFDRTLDSTRFRHATGYRPPSWPEMIREMAEDPTPYDSWRTDP
jgi:dTDP-4-dehydrorhamnose reductase